MLNKKKTFTYGTRLVWYILSLPSAAASERGARPVLRSGSVSMTAASLGTEQMAAHGPPPSSRGGTVDLAALVMPAAGGGDTSTRAAWATADEWPNRLVTAAGQPQSSRDVIHRAEKQLLGHTVTGNAASSVKCSAN